MKDVTYVKEPLQAYIIPSEDAHQVNIKVKAQQDNSVNALKIVE